MNKQLPLSGFACFILLIIFTFPFSLRAQVCGGDAPAFFDVITNPANPSECFLQINWGDAMPEILCGNPGSPALGSTIPEGRRIEFLYATINGTQYTLYDRNDCASGVTTIQYGVEANTYITAFDEVDFCLAIAEHAISVSGVQLNADNFDCLLLNAQTAAPVELAYFKGRAAERNNVLEWATLSEENTAVFVVEKSGDGRRNIETLGTMTAVGFSNATEVYQMEDSEPRPLTYYRLRSIDFDGSEMASDWIAVRRAAGANKLLQVGPVPLGNQALEVTYEAQFDERVNLLIADINGRQLWSESKTLETGIHHWTFALPNFQQNLLVLQIHTREGIISRLIPRVVQD